MWFGKYFGSIMGFMTGGPLGALFGMIAGNTFDESLKNFSRQQWHFSSRSDHRELNQKFLEATFLALGSLAKSDGRVEKSDILIAEQIIQHFELNDAQATQAKAWFTTGKNNQADRDKALKQLRREAILEPQYLSMLISILVQAACQRGAPSPAKYATLKQTALALNISLRQLDALISQCRQFKGNTATNRSVLNDREAYRILGVNASANGGEIKKAYRRLMSQHHPDKQVSKGASEAQISQSKEKSQQIQAAYDLLKQRKPARS